MSAVRARARVTGPDAASRVSGRAPQRRREVSRARLVEIQRARLLSAAADAIDERGCSETTVAHITARAGVSRRTFYDLFADREECLLAVLDDAVAGAREQLQRALDAAGPDWRERVRAGLWTLLALLDREPVLARVCVLRTPSGGPRVLERRDAVLAELARALDAGRGRGARAQSCPPLTGEGLVGAVSTVLYRRLARDSGEPLRDLFGELLQLILLPYRGAAAARRERGRGAPESTRAGGADGADGADGAGDGGTRGALRQPDPLAGLPMRLTYRTARVLEAIARAPHSSNRTIGAAAEIADPGQISRLLARLERLGLAHNTRQGQAKGEPNVWVLTDTGLRVARNISAPAERPNDKGVDR